VNPRDTSVPNRDGAVAPGRLVLLGHPVAHSLSPTFQNAALDAARLRVRYEPLDVAPGDLARTLDELRAARAAGNVTVPHKQAVAVHCDALTSVAREVGAVNTFWHAADGALVGENTDVAGVTAALRAVADGAGGLRPARVALLGAGGAAAAVVAAVAQRWPTAHVAIWSRRPSAAAALAARSGERTAAATSVAAALGGASLVVNATPLGLRADDPLPCDVGALSPRAAVLDLVYGPRETAWVRAARAAGHDAHDGLLMLVEQGAAAFERWFGVPADRTRMWDAVCERTGRLAPRGSYP